MAQALRVVNELPDHRDPPTGDVSLTQETIASWSTGQRRCRGRKRHNWNPGMVYEHATFFEVTEQCSHCRNRRKAHYVRTTFGLRKEGKWQPDYRDGYLLPKGAQRIDDDLQDELVAADILSRRIIEVPDRDDED